MAVPLFLNPGFISWAAGNPRLGVTKPLLRFLQLGRIPALLARVTSEVASTHRRSWLGSVPGRVAAVAWRLACKAGRSDNGDRSGGPWIQQLRASPGLGGSVGGRTHSTCRCRAVRVVP